MTLLEIYRLVQRDLEEVEVEFRRQLDSPIECVQDARRFLVESGGKRIRPALLLLAARLFGHSGGVASRLAAVVELIHTATLIHDDIVDEADVRRGQQTLNRRWGSDVTVLLGDFLYIRGVALALAHGNPPLLEIISTATQRMIEGELIQLANNGRIDITEEEHLDTIRRKTAYLFSASCEIGAVIAGAGGDERQRLHDYGMDLGMSFQIVDDVLDYTSTSAALGKPVVNDLKEGCLTLPLIYLLREDGAGYLEMIQTVLREKGFDSVSAERVVAAVNESGAVGKALGLARSYGESARARLATLPDSETKRALLTLPDLILERSH